MPIRIKMTLIYFLFAAKQASLEGIYDERWQVWG
jgi:hypothetical protein